MWLCLAVNFCSNAQAKPVRVHRSLLLTHREVDAGKFGGRVDRNSLKMFCLVTERFPSSTIYALASDLAIQPHCPEVTHARRIHINGHVENQFSV